MPSPYAPIGMTVDSTTVRNARPPGQPGRPRTTPPDSEEPTNTVPKLYEVATDQETIDQFSRPLYSQDPAYQFGVNIDYALNNVDEWAVTRATRQAFARSMRSWGRYFLRGRDLTDEEWSQMIGARNLKKPARVNRNEAMWWIRQYDSDLVIQKMHRNGRDPYLQLLVGGIIGGLADPINIITARLFPVVTPLLGGPAKAAFSNVAASVGAARYGQKLLNSAAFVNGSRILAETAATVPFERHIADVYGEQYGLGDFAIQVGAIGGLSLLAAASQRVFRRLKLSPVDEVTARAKAAAVVDGTPDADVITPRTVEEHMRPGDAFDDVPIDSGKTPTVKSPFDRSALEKFEEGPQFDIVRSEDAEAALVQHIDDLRKTHKAAESARSVDEASTNPKVTDASLVRHIANEDLAPAIAKAERNALIAFAAGRADLLEQRLAASLGPLIKKSWLVSQMYGDRLVKLLDDAQLSGPQLRKVAEDIAVALGVDQPRAREIMLDMSGYKAKIFLQDIMNSAKRETGFAVVPAIEGPRLIQNVHKALWLMANSDPKAHAAVAQWLDALGVRGVDSPEFRHALTEASMRYRADFLDGARLNPLDYLDQALMAEPDPVVRKAPVDQAREIAEARRRGDPVAPSDVVPIRTLVGNEDIATPGVTQSIRAEVDSIAKTGKIGDMQIDDASKAVVADVLASVDKLAETLRKCVRKG